MNPPHHRILCFKFGWDWPSGSEEDENVKSLRQHWQRDNNDWQRTNFDQKSSLECLAQVSLKVLILQLTLAKSPCENFMWQKFHRKFTWKFHMKFTWICLLLLNSRENFHVKFIHSHFACVGSLYAVVLKHDVFRSNLMRSTLHTPVSPSQTSACRLQLQGTTDPITTTGCEISVVMLCFRR